MQFNLLHFITCLQQLYNSHYLLSQKQNSTTVSYQVKYMKLQKNEQNQFKKSIIKINRVISQKAVEMFGSGDWNELDQEPELLYDKNSEVHKIKINGFQLVKKRVFLKGKNSQEKERQEITLMINEKQIMEKLLANPQKYLVEPYRVQQSQKGQLIIYMEYLPKKTLKDYLQSKQYKKFKQSNCQQCQKRNSFIMLQILLAVYQLHQLEYVHRDLKPANIFIDQNFNIKLGDFGSTQYLHKEDYHLVGTFGYVCPEMVFDSHRLSMVFSHLKGQDKTYEQSDYMKIDMWSLGVIFYELFHKDGNMPYKLTQLGQKSNNNIIQAYQYLFKMTYQQLFKQKTETQKWIENMINQMLVRDQHERPSWKQIYTKNLINFLKTIQTYNFLDKQKKESMKEDFLKAKPFYQIQCYKIRQKRQKEDEFLKIYDDLYHEMSKNTKMLIKSKVKAKNINQRQKILDYLHQFHACLNKLIEINQKLDEDKHDLSQIYKELYQIKYFYQANTGTKIQQRIDFRKEEVMCQSVKQLNIKIDQQKKIKN